LRPYLLLDIDGVFNPEFWGRVGWRKLRRDGWIRLKIRVTWSEVPLLVYLHPSHGAMVLEVARDTGAELAWGSAWREWAETHIGPAIGLPPIPVLLGPGSPEDGESFGSWKARGLIPRLDGRPFVWLDDDPDVAVVAAELASQPHLVITVDPLTGLTSEHLAQARAWLSSYPQS
jgi:hypothetical protein